MTRSDAIPAFTIIPAQPGWSVCYYLSGDEVRCACFIHYPIVAWKVEHTLNEEMFEHNTVPVVIGTSVLSKDYVIKRPDGKFEIIDRLFFDTEEEALKHMEKHYLEEQAS